MRRVEACPAAVQDHAPVRVGLQLQPEGKGKGGVAAEVGELRREGEAGGLEFREFASIAHHPLQRLVFGGTPFH